MNDQWRPKFHIGHDDFSIQYLSRTGATNMPRPHEHSSFELYYLLNGERIYFMEDQVVTVRKGDLMIIYPHQLHSTASTEKQRFERILVNFSPAFIEQGGGQVTSLLRTGGSRLVRVPLKDQPDVERLLRAMLAECEGAQTYYESLVRIYLSELLIRIRRIELSMHARAGTEYEHPMHHKITEIAQYIKANYHQKLTLEQIAKQFYISPSHLSRTFAKLTGFRFREYLQTVRIREAQKRLAESKDSVQRISEQAGFEHIAHFNKTFKKIVGTTPLDYRKRHG